MLGWKCGGLVCNSIINLLSDFEQITRSGIHPSVNKGTWHQDPFSGISVFQSMAQTLNSITPPSNFLINCILTLIISLLMSRTRLGGSVSNATCIQLAAVHRMSFLSTCNPWS